jgi:FkbM family methyltransferase
VSNAAGRFARYITSVRKRLRISRARAQGSIALRLLKKTFVIETPAGPVSFVLLGRVAAARAKSLLTKQPATIEWIDQFSADSVFWDVGANVGVYTLYAALRGKTRVVAIEPAAVNYFLLTANCEANRLDGRVDCLLLGLGDGRAVTRLAVSQFEPARSFSFRERPNQRYSFDGRQAALILSIDDLVSTYGLPCPNYIKIDAPGMSEAIIAGGMQTLQRPDVREVHIELREQSKGGRRIAEMLAQAGFSVAGRHGHRGSADVTFTKAGAGTGGGRPL